VLNLVLAGMTVVPWVDHMSTMSVSRSSASEHGEEDHPTKQDPKIPPASLFPSDTCTEQDCPPRVPKTPQERKIYKTSLMNLASSIESIAMTPKPLPFPAKNPLPQFPSRPVTTGRSMSSVQPGSECDSGGRISELKTREKGEGGNKRWEGKTDSWDISSSSDSDPHGRPDPVDDIDLTTPSQQELKPIQGNWGQEPSRKRTRQSYANGYLAVRIEGRIVKGSLPNEISAIYKDRRTNELWWRGYRLKPKNIRQFSVLWERRRKSKKSGKKKVRDVCEWHKLLPTQWNNLLDRLSPPDGVKRMRDTIANASSLDPERPLEKMPKVNLSEVRSNPRLRLTNVLLDEMQRTVYGNVNRSGQLLEPEFVGNADGGRREEDSAILELSRRVIRHAHEKEKADPMYYDDESDY